MSKRRIHLYLNLESLEKLTNRSYRTYSGEVNYLISKAVEKLEEAEKQEV